jgi:uncharacterized protein with GYD domain
MATFIMCGKYSLEALKGIKAERTEKSVKLIEKFGGKVKAMYAVLGERDLVFILDFPGIEEAARASIALTKMTGIAFSTSPAISVDQFDKITAKL